MSPIAPADNPLGTETVVQSASRPTGTDPVQQSTSSDWDSTPRTPPNRENDDPIEEYNNTQTTPTPNRRLPSKVELTGNNAQPARSSRTSLSEARPLAEPYRKDDTLSRAVKSKSAIKRSRAASVADSASDSSEAESEAPPVIAQSSAPSPSIHSNLHAPTPTVPGIFNPEHNPLNAYPGKSRDPREPITKPPSIRRHWDDESEDEEMDLEDPRTEPGPKNFMEAVVNAYLKTNNQISTLANLPWTMA